MQMIRNPHIRRPLAIILVAAGALLLFLAPATWAGVALLILGIAIEVVGISLKK